MDDRSWPDDDESSGTTPFALQLPPAAAWRDVWGAASRGALLHAWRPRRSEASGTPRQGFFGRLVSPGPLATPRLRP